MRSEAWSEPRRYEDDWIALGWGIVNSDLLLPYYRVFDGATPCAFLPHFLRGPAREYVLCGMMVSIAERYPDEPNVMMVREQPTQERVNRLQQSLDADIGRNPGSPDEPDADRVIRWGRTPGR